MSNKIVPGIYRAVIDDVMTAIRPAFDEIGIGEEVLAELQHKWETKVIASRVANFNPSSASSASNNPRSIAHPSSHSMSQTAIQGASLQPYGYGNGNFKTEYMYTLPTLPGPNLALPNLPGPQLASLGMSRSAASSNSVHPTFGNPHLPNANAALAGMANVMGLGLQFPTYQPPRLPQTDGPADGDSEDEEYDEVPAYAPRAPHPSLPPPLPAGASSSNSNSRAKAAPTSTSQPAPSANPGSREDNEADGTEEIGSDLDDSDTDNEVDVDVDGGGVEGDIVFCTYDKVARVKNKWKCVLKDGMMHSGGKDYLFQRCTGEFEW
ncbi:transcription factor IIA alpha/beta subunit [Mycena maculata]|uniref:Transcription factor IIA alpha/beta subunit n=1 Tax=Mycena maculata TaxID=230809 RepID=A0AAD7H9B6_9AGAR|nr:transcription factor IIA alpha/beta subunit [Mycena maculata]